MKDTFKSNIKIPSGLRLFLKNELLTVKGPKDSLSLNLSSRSKHFPCSFRLFQKVLVGIHLGFVLRLAFIGVGFRVEEINDGFLKLKLGFSHFVFIRIPSYIKVVAPKKTLLVLKSMDDHLLNEFALRVRSFKLPDVYKGKGITLKNQILILKEGKKK
jgi:large subunit ribosomal protein L6